MLKLNVGLSKKLGQANYGSIGGSVHIEVEADSGLVAEPDRLRDRIRQVFSLARTALDEELHGHNGGNGNASPPANGNGAAANGNGHANGSSPRQESRQRPATASQVRALNSIAKRLGVDLGQVVREHYRVDRPESLGIKQASELIDDLKSKGG